MSSSSKRNGRGLSARALRGFLANSYAGKKQQKSLNGYQRDSSLSGKRSSVYFHPESNHAIVVHKGTQSIQDWGTNAMSAIGQVHRTTRGKHAQKIQNAAEAKYGRDNVLTTGHSLGAKLAETVGQNSKEVITYNKPTTLENVRPWKRISSKQTDVRTSNDPVSLLAGWQRGQNKIKTIRSDTWNPLTAHNTDQLAKMGDTHVGNGVRGPSRWVAHVKQHAAQYGVSYGEAMKAARATYKR